MMCVRHIKVMGNIEKERDSVSEWVSESVREREREATRKRERDIDRER